MIDLRLMEDAVAPRSLPSDSPGGRRPLARGELTRGADLKPVRLSASGEREDRGAGFLLSFVLLMMLYTTVLMWGQAVLTSVIEEKTNRVVEVIVSAVGRTTCSRASSWAWAPPASPSSWPGCSPCS